MRWHQVIRAARLAILADDVLTALYGTRVRMASVSGDRAEPVLEIQLIADGQEELWAPCTLQFDQWFPSDAEHPTGADDLLASEERLGQLFNHDVPVEIAGVMMWAEYQGGEWLATPDRNNQYGRAVRFRFSPLRSRYDVTEPVAP